MRLWVHVRLVRAVQEEYLHIGQSTSHMPVVNTQDNAAAKDTDTGSCRLLHTMIELCILQFAHLKRILRSTSFTQTFGNTKHLVSDVPMWIGYSQLRKF